MRDEACTIHAVSCVWFSLILYIRKHNLFNQQNLIKFTHFILPNYSFNK